MDCSGNLDIRFQGLLLKAMDLFGLVKQPGIYLLMYYVMPEYIV